jgi:sugar lactone lactonase YvrE
MAKYTRLRVYVKGPGKSSPDVPRSMRPVQLQHTLATNQFFTTVLFASALFFGFSGSALLAQGVLTVTPGPSVATVVGTGMPGYTGDDGPATSATLASPSAVAYDGAGDLFIADAANHVVREITAAGVISTIAGNGLEGYGGDNGPATSATLDTPTGVAVNSNGNVYIADSHNHRIREVSGGTITTIAGTGVAGFSGDGAAATAQLDMPTAVAVDAAGNVYIADTNNQRIRKITGTTISTIAGTGEETFAGDGASAIDAVLDTPTGVAVDSSGNVYIADRHNQRIRKITGTTITTFAGSGSGFSGNFSGEGGSATAASLAKPSGISVDAAGNVYIADTGNQRIREVAANGSAIATIIGSGQQGYGGDSFTPASLNLNMPKSTAVSVTGSVAISDKLNERVRATTLPTLDFGSDPFGATSTPQTVTLANTGSAPITVSSAAFTGPFSLAAGGTCSASPIMIAAGASCTEAITFLPIATGLATGSVVYSGAGIVPGTVLLTGTGVQATPMRSVTSVSVNRGSITPGQSVTVSAEVTSATTGTPTGTVSFYDNGTLLGAVTLSGGAASYSTTALAPGMTHTLTASYGGDANFMISSSTAGVVVAVAALDFTLKLTGPGSQTVVPGNSIAYQFNVSPLYGSYAGPVSFTVTGLPTGATATFSPASFEANAGPQAATLTIDAPAATAMNQNHSARNTALFALLLLPLWGVRKRKGLARLLCLLVLALGGAAATSMLTGCGTEHNGYFGQTQQSYNVTITATSGTLVHSTNVTLTVE